ncbi:MAG: DNA topoisomerase I, partial [Thaumarchaeota archaeon]|nr:DNA topoisomerase I [Nitrososphaerota archaeon]
ERVEKIRLQVDLATKTRDYNLGTSLRNYIDPRVFKAWTDEVGAEWEKLYTSALQKKFLWVKSENESWKTVSQYY